MISVVIPVLNEGGVVLATLRSVLADPMVCECIVVDGGSSDDTLKKLETIKDERLKTLTSQPGRGHQMNTGAERATGQILLFVHGDTLMPFGFGYAIRRVSHTKASFWGCFRHQFHPNNWRLRLISLLHNWRCKMSGVAYGDQAIFISAAVFKQIGGFARDALEDVRLSEAALEAVGKPIRVALTVRTSSRKFLAIGEFRALGQVVSIIRNYRKNQSLGNQDFFENYR